MSGPRHALLERPQQTAVDGVIKARHFEVRDFGGVRGLVGECEGCELNVVRMANGVSRR